MIPNDHAPGFAKRSGIEESQSLGAIAQNELLLVMAQAPAFTRITERSMWREAGQIVDKGEL